MDNSIETREGKKRNLIEERGGEERRGFGWEKECSVSSLDVVNLLYRQKQKKKLAGKYLHYGTTPLYHQPPCTINHSAIHPRRFKKK